MGAIAVVLAREAGVDSTALLERMLGASPHRGSAFKHRALGDVVLGVSNAADRLDSTLASAGELAAAYSGTLLNATELTKTLAEAQCAPACASPAGVLLAAFRAYGASAANRLRGEFAAVITDGHRLWCFRDHLGIRPLFYRDDHRAFFAATEPKQILAVAAITREPDLEVLEGIFYGVMPEDMPSAFKGIKRQPKATTLVVGPTGSAPPEAFWHPEALLETAHIKAEEVAPRFTELFDRVVGRNVTGNDVVSLSGGVDSPAVAAFAAPHYHRLTGKPLPALSSVFPDLPNVDERPYIEAVTAHLGMTLHTNTLKARGLDDVEQWCEWFDAPVPTINTPQILEYNTEAKRLGYTNILTGELAEPVVDLRGDLATHLLLHARFSALARLLRTERQQGRGLRSLAALVTEGFVPARVANWYTSARRLDAPERIPHWLDRNRANRLRYRRPLSVPAHRRWLDLQTGPLQGCPITMEAAQLASDLAGVSVARPFVDIDLWEFFLRLPAEIKQPDLKTKTLLKRMLRGRVPDVILDRRRKTVFNDHEMTQIDYALIRRYLGNPTYRMPGVDYAALALRLERQDFTLWDWVWARDLVRISAFMNQWR
jgi:asparagine synthase (glutamine-hydrolysing)